MTQTPKSPQVELLAIHHPKRFLAIAFLLASVTTTMNEWVFYSRLAGEVVSIGVLIAVTALAIRKNYKALLYLIVSAYFLFSTRPRGIHIIPLEMRGDYDFYSPNILHFGGPTVTTFATFLIFIVVVNDALFSGQRTAPRRIFSLALFSLFISITGIIHSLSIVTPVDTATAISDIKYPIFIATGALLVNKSGMHIYEMFRLIALLGLTLGITTAFLFVMDVSSGQFLLSYNANTYLSIIALGCLTCGLRITGPTCLAIFILTALGAIPIVRGEQAIFAITIALALGWTFLFQRSRSSAIKAIGLLGTMAPLVIYLASADNSLSQFAVSKAALFFSGSMDLDKSSAIRVMEVRSITGLNSLGSWLEVLFGKGFGATFMLPTTELGGLDLSDFSRSEIAANAFKSPHLFSTYWVLKYGILGSFALLLILTTRLRGDRMAIRFYYVALPTLLWQGYWSPGYALLTGLLLELASGGKTGRKRYSISNSAWGKCTRCPSPHLRNPEHIR